MKRWTVMVIPDGPGSTRSFTLNSAYLWVPWCAGILIVALAFNSSFFLKRYLIAQAETSHLRHQQALAGQAAPVAVLPDRDLNRESAVRTEVERELRAEYEKAFSAITSELQQIYQVESQMREMHGLPPRIPGQSAAPVLVAEEGGKGGGPGSLLADIQTATAVPVRPQSYIQGLARPSADLLYQEIKLREESLGTLLENMQARADRIARTPSIWPTRHPRRAISSAFGMRVHPILKRVRFHEGTDITAPHGSPVIATGKGRVLFAGWENYYGNIVKIDHGHGVQTWYAHLSRCTVKAGDEVDRGQEIGKLGSTGMSTGPHIHYEVRINGTPVDSGLYLGN
jgi:murein DD-endopeptidase MepM/ murein hydrolase activator NlpD